MAKFTYLLCALYAALCTAWILIVPMNQYEWMLEDPALRGEVMTYCELPVDHDSHAALLAFLPLLPLLAVGLIVSAIKGRIHPATWGAAVPLAVWAGRFLAFAPSC